MSTVLLIHPPALSAVVWGPLEAELSGAGHRVAVADYTAELSVAASWWRRATRACCLAVDELLDTPPPAPADREGRRRYPAHATGPDVVVAFSGAGVLVPLVCHARPPRRAVFLDAGLPAPDGGETAPSADVRRMVAALPRDGDRLPPWTRWWPEDDLVRLLPDAALREQLDRGAPALPADFFDEAVGGAPGWEPPGVTYVRLSAAYDEHAAQAQERGWEVRHADLDHLAPITRPAEVMALLRP